MLKIIRQSHEIWGECPTDFVEALKRIEKVGRICYQSGEKITDDSYARFVKMLCDHKHGAMIEHSQLVIHSRCRQAHLDDSRFIERRGNDSQGYIYAGNYRAFMEASVLPSVEELQCYWSHQLLGEEIPLWAKAITVVFKTDRAMSHELVRHRPASYGQLSQRYVDHKKSIEFILPTHYYGKQEMNPKYDEWLRAMYGATRTYGALREYGETPQEARKVLPNSTATEIAVTCNVAEWAHVFKLRCSPAADPQMRALMIPVRDEFLVRGWV